MSMKSLVIHDMQKGIEHEYRIRHDQPAAVLEASFAPRRATLPKATAT